MASSHIVAAIIGLAERFKNEDCAHGKDLRYRGTPGPDNQLHAPRLEQYLEKSLAHLYGVIS